ncbi:phosphoglycerate kinase [Candidatus Undinarchaeota archaeon]
MKNFLDLKSADLKNKTVLVRLDINAPLDPTTGEFLDERRLNGAKPTIDFLYKKGAKVVILAHQGRPGDEYEFTTTEKHAKKLSKILEKDVKYVDDIFGSNAKKAIKNMKSGEIILLENVRFYSEELLNRPADAQTKSHMVRNLAPLVDYYVNDAFAAAHRSQPSLVGFTTVLPSFPGMNMEEELTVLEKFTHTSKKKCIFVLGGTKVGDSLKVIDQALSTKSADEILTSGVVAILFLAAKGYDLGEPTEVFLKGNDLEKHIPYAKKLIDKYDQKIHIPIDVALNKHGERMEVSLRFLPMPYRIVDIGSGTIGRYSYLINTSDKILANGPAGYFEVEPFALGTNSILEAISKSKGFTVVGGGHLAVAAEHLKLTDKINHISTAGGACILYLAGDTLSVLEALKASADKFKKKVKGGKKK